MSAVHRIAALGLASLVCAPIWAAAPKVSSEAQQRYKQERARCISGPSGQDRATCLREAGAALQEARRNGLQSQGGADLKSNATARCNAQPAADRDACVRRVTGAGSTQGSVSGGGLIREVETPVK
jgi:hypothetical protein